MIIYLVEESVGENGWNHAEAVLDTDAEKVLFTIYAENSATIVEEKTVEAFDLDICVSDGKSAENVKYAKRYLDSYVEEMGY